MTNAVTQRMRGYWALSAIFISLAGIGAGTALVVRTEAGYVDFETSQLAFTTLILAAVIGACLSAVSIVKQESALLWATALATSAPGIWFLLWIIAVAASGGGWT